MKPAIDEVKGRIVKFDPVTDEVTIIAKYSDIFTLTKREYKECYIQMIDSRPLSEKQRKACYALLREISDYTGMEMDLTKEYFKVKFLTEDLQETADRLFSLSNASMSLVCEFQAFLIDFIVSWNIPTKMPLYMMVDDIERYVYACLVNKRCCICGQPAELHHSEQAVGMGRNREEIIHEGMKVLPLCRVHHTEAHTVGKVKFQSKYHLCSGVKLDKVLCKLFGLKTNKENKQ